MQVTQTSMQYQSTNISYKKETNTKETLGTSQSLSMNARFVAFEFQSSEISKLNSSAQSGLFNMTNANSDIKDFLMGMDDGTSLSLADLGYKGKPILNLNSQEATTLVSDGGFFSVENTAQRAIGFVLAGAGDDVGKLKEGREGIVKGFAQAEKLWGGKLPDIAYETQKLTLEKIDEKIQSLGANVLDLAA